MKVSREQVAENRRRILDAASKLFREKGFDGVGLDAVMKAAGLTHGAFYGHFKSKDDLVAQVCAYALSQSDDSWKEATDPAGALAAAYLAPDHCDDRAGGCLFAALGGEVGRQKLDARHAVTEALRHRIDCLTDRLSGPPSERRDQAIAIWAGLVGALVLARSVDDQIFSDEILRAGIDVFGKQAGQPSTSKLAGRAAGPSEPAKKKKRSRVSG